MKRRLIAVADDDEALLARLERWLERKAPRKAGGTISDEDVPEDLDRYLPGRTYGRYGETIALREIRYGSPPGWFDPRSNPGQYGIFADGDMRIYLQVEVDEAKRAESDRGMETIAELAVATPEQRNLFGDDPGGSGL